MATLTDDAPRALFGGGRSCAGCTLCCTIMGIKALDKPRNTPCPHCDHNVGCGIYNTRPGECAGFYCTWLYAPTIEDHWRPAASGMVLHYDQSVSRMEVHVDPARPDAWRSEPHHAQLRAWAQASAPQGGQVIVWIGEDLIAILPDRDKPLGTMREDQLLVGHERMIDGAWSYDIVVMDVDDPRLAPPD